MLRPIQEAKTSLAIPLNSLKPGSDPLVALESTILRHFPVTPSERGITFTKLFPAEPVGGVGLMKSLAAPLRDLQFCPTRGVGLSNAADYLALPNTACIGGSWMVPKASLAARDWRSIERFAARAREKAAAPKTKAG